MLKKLLTKLNNIYEKTLQKIDIEVTYINIKRLYMTKPQQTLSSMLKNQKYSL